MWVSNWVECSAACLAVQLVEAKVAHWVVRSVDLKADWWVVYWADQKVGTLGEPKVAR